MSNKIDQISETEWESLCLKCGQCCHKKLQTKYIFIVNPTETCEHLVNKTCTIYENRLQPGKCIHIKEALKTNLMLPISCPYTKLKSGYQGFVMPNEETFNHIMLICLIIQNEEKKLGRNMTKEEIRDLEITQEKIDEIYVNNKN